MKPHFHILSTTHLLLAKRCNRMHPSPYKYIGMCCVHICCCNMACLAISAFNFTIFSFFSTSVSSTPTASPPVAVTHFSRLPNTTKEVNLSQSARQSAGSEHFIRHCCCLCAFNHSASFALRSARTAHSVSLLSLLITSVTHRVILTQMHTEFQQSR